MNLFLNNEQSMLQDAAARLFAEQSSPARVRAAEATGFDGDLWTQLFELGLPTLRVPESMGGSGLGTLEAALIMEQAGRHLASVPLAEAIVANRLLAQLEGTEARQWLERALAGALVTLAPMPAESGPQVFLPGASAAAGVLVLRDDQILLVCNPSEGVHNLGALAISAAKVPRDTAGGDAICLAQGEQARCMFEAAVEEWKVLTAAALAGLSHRALEMAAEYANEREAFGRPIGSYQGIAHPLADSLTECDGAQLLTWHAIWAVANERRDGAAAISMAWWWATQSSARAVTRALHTFGGYGVSLEYDIQLYYRRAKAWALLAGDPHLELGRVGERLWQQAAVALPEVGEVTLDFSAGAAASEFATEVRHFFDAHLTDELRAKAHHSVSGYDAGFSRQLAEAGLRYPHWPKEYGGRAVSPFEMSALDEEFVRQGWESVTGPVTNQVAQIVMRLASEELKAEVLPKFARGDTLACLGFTEPSCGSDMYAAKTRAERDGGDWIINGQKMFTTAGNLADYIFLLTRTDPDLPRHKGITVFLVPMDLPGIELHPVHTLQDERTNITYLSDVRVPDRYRIGEVNGGIKVMAATMELEHGGDHYRISYAMMFEQAVQWASAQPWHDARLIDRPDCRERLGRVAVHTTIAKALCYRAIWAIENQMPNRAHFGPMSKVFSTEFYQRDATDLMDLAAPWSLVTESSGLEQVELGYRQSIGTTIYGGTSEVHRSLIAEYGLKLPKSRS